MARERLREAVAEAVDDLRMHAEALGERDEVRRPEVDAVRRRARPALVVAQHPVAAVVDDHGRQRQLLLRDRRKLTDHLQPNSEVYVFQALSGG